MVLPMSHLMNSLKFLPLKLNMNLSTMNMRKLLVEIAPIHGQLKLFVTALLDQLKQRYS